MSASFRSFDQEQERLRLWRAWGEARERDFQAAIALLPGPAPTLDFSLARALLTAHRQAPSLNPPPAAGLVFSWSAQQAIWNYEKDSAASRALACADDLWRWSPDEIRLRERAFSLSDPLLAPELAREMARLTRAPWRRWSAASPAAPALFNALDALGHQEPAIAAFGAASLPALMGLSGLPVAAWAQAVARVSRPEAFVAESAPTHHIFSSQLFSELLAAHPEAFPDLPARDGCGENYSRSLDVESVAFATPERLARQSALGLMDHPRLPSLAADFEAAMASPFFKACLSQRASGLPKGFDHCWPLAYPRAPSGSGASRERSDHMNALRELVRQGARSDDIHNGALIWEPFVEATCEQGSEGYYAPISHEILALLFDSGADFRSTSLRPELMRSRLVGAPERMSLADYYRLGLESHRADMALETLAPWMARCLARAESEALDQACAPAAPRHAAPL